MRHPLIVLTVVSLSAPLFGQVAAQEKQAPPALPALPLPHLTNPPAAPVKNLTAPGEGLPFRNWRDLLAKNAHDPEQGPKVLMRGEAPNGWGAAGHCSVPLIEMPLAESFDEPMVKKMRPHLDDKMIITPPPVCALHGAFADKTKRK